MSIRPPRRARQRRDALRLRQYARVAGISLVVVIVALRVLMASVDVAPWTIAWRIVDLPTGPLVELPQRITLLRQSPLGRLTIADLLLALMTCAVALTLLSASALRRDA